MSNISKYVKRINQEVFPKLTTKKVVDEVEMKKILKEMTDIFADTYGTKCIYEGMDKLKEDEGFVMVPGVVKSKKTGKVRLALLDLDVSSSGEHYGTTFITEKGIVQQGCKDVPEHIKEYMSELIPYEYCYTVDIEDDIHIDKSDIDEDIMNIINY